MSGQNVFVRSAGFEDALSRAAAECGIDLEYWDIFHKKHEVSSEALKRILHALGWDVESVESIDRERGRRFDAGLQRAVPKTVVIAETEQWVPLTLPASGNASIRYEIALENGENIAGSIETDQLATLREASHEGRQWFIRQLQLPPEIPLGYHMLRLSVNGQSAGETNLIVCPNRAYVSDGLAKGGKTAGFNVALYGLRSDRNWGCGDFTDLQHLSQWAHQDIGFSFIGLNPLHALHNRVPYNTSPYLPLSVFYKNLIYLDIERVPEFQTSACAQTFFRSQRVQEKINALRAAEFVDYHGVDWLKKRFLKILYREFRKQGSARSKNFAAYCEAEGDLLHKFALYSALDEILHKQDRNRWTWRDWPPEFHSPDSAETREFSKRYARTVEFYKYIQFVIDEQLAATQAYAKEHGMDIGLYHDLAVATDSCGSDLWAHGEFFVSGCRVGAPPDDFSPNGQDWSFPPPNSRAHRENGYRLYRESIRKIVNKGAGALRIDHVMRLFRLFWIPGGMSAAQGTYVRDYAVDLMRILALESVRSRNIVIGEDLGTVTDEIRDMLARFGILSYRLFYFEKQQPSNAFKHSYEYPRQALVASATHDLPTLAGFWQNRDIEARRAAGLVDEAGYWQQINDRKLEKQRMLDVLHEEHLLPEYSERSCENVFQLSGELHNAAIGFLAQVPSMILLLNQEDFTKETEQQNLPGSTAQYPNWQRKMRLKIEELRSPEAQGYAAMFRNQLARTGRM